MKWVNISKLTISCSKVYLWLGYDSSFSIHFQICRSVILQLKAVPLMNREKEMWFLQLIQIYLLWKRFEISFSVESDFCSWIYLYWKQFAIFFSIESTPPERGNRNVNSTAGRNIFGWKTWNFFGDFPAVHQGVISGGDCLGALNIQTNWPPTVDSVSKFSPERHSSAAEYTT